MSCILKTSTAMGDGVCGATQPDKLVLRIMGHEHLVQVMGHEHLVEAMGTSVEAKQEQKKKKKIKIAYEVN